MKKTISTLTNLKNKRIFLRVDFNVPLDENQNITSDNRIIEAMPTINYLINAGAKIIIASHLGRPNGVDPKLSLKPVAKRLSELLEKDVVLAVDVAGKDSVSKMKKLNAGDVLMLENLRFDEGEEANDPVFVEKLASLCDVYVNDAFGTAHRKHASVYGLPLIIKDNAVGLLMEKEVNIIGNALENPERPFVAILGGSKITDKIKVINNLLDRVDTLIVGGGMAYTFIKVLGGNIGKSICDDTKLDLAKELLAKAKEKGVNFMLPVDNGCGLEFSRTAKRKTFNTFAIPSNYQGLDIGPKTIKIFTKALKGAKTIIWNGTLGVAEFKNFALGTNKIAKAVCKTKATTIIGGGDSAAAIIALGLEEKVSHISTGGGASLALLEGQKLPGLEVITNA